ncbi:MAG: tRNA1(Val) (adenine(37)-N6)-methyltransferase [Inconstantimicrobium porci]|uniref:tRNA1(Val) (Adenine(37)-N6)-methyltransferase n=1 Tax=Inconstantimicrobium porci TaxID=2652291 RepID=A0A7X2MZ59_9CLOT|nr:tRNA1(Val) (adenine(37)-N6)-methyltransferase [Inconstantimicrobium porci]MDD6771726.1 tRNA1(Val) (adenine(37)-N6)-methyltransferase [Inconstantimicrobium porci]MDY5911566.1 tRNA1(Val) (adenine(37)-N6)-methyltransferase [Inconstantimicrobium porci]MSR91792.1 tRNA1(Val) (adenine(37)-N6)-methyltransferase [Inconstantimicrobium porci]
MDLVREDETLDDLQLNGINIIQKKKAFRFGIDAVLLANYANVKNNHTVIDLCTGTGIVPFIIAGKTKAKKVLGIEIQDEFVEMAHRSVEINNLQDRVDFMCADLKDTAVLKKLERADVVTVNPPYKLMNAGIKNATDKLTIARHEVLCNLENVIAASRILLKDNGRLYMVHRPERLADIFCLMRKYKIEPKRVQFVHPSAKKAPNIVLVEGQRDGGSFLKFEEPLYVYDDKGCYTKEIDEIYGRG